MLSVSLCQFLTKTMLFKCNILSFLIVEIIRKFLIYYYRIHKLHIISFKETRRDCQMCGHRNIYVVFTSSQGQVVYTLKPVTTLVSNA